MGCGCLWMSTKKWATRIKNGNHKIEWFFESFIGFSHLLFLNLYSREWILSSWFCLSNGRILHSYWEYEHDGSTDRLKAAVIMVSGNISVQRENFMIGSNDYTASLVSFWEDLKQQFCLKPEWSSHRRVHRE